MKIDRDLWEDSYFLDSLPHWKCPVCKRGYLVINKDILYTHEIPESKKSDKLKDKQKQAIGFLLCSNPGCGEVSGFTGLVTYERDYMKKGSPYMESISPVVIAPMPEIFELIDDYPSDVIDEIQKSFSLFWLDKASCANKIRNALDLILTDKRIPKFLSKSKQDIDGGTKKRRILLPLHARIKKFEEKSKLIGEHMMAVKWIGNAGSHLDELENDEILDGFEMLQFVLKSLYDDDIKRIDKIKKKYIDKY